MQYSAASPNYKAQRCHLLTRSFARSLARRPKLSYAHAATPFHVRQKQPSFYCYYYYYFSFYRYPADPQPATLLHCADILRRRMAEE